MRNSLPHSIRTARYEIAWRAHNVSPRLVPPTRTVATRRRRERKKEVDGTEPDAIELPRGNAKPDKGPPVNGDLSPNPPLRATARPPNAWEMSALRTPAAIETIRWRSLTKWRISSSKAGIVCGLTARTKTSLPLTTSRLSPVAGHPVSSWNFARAAATGSLALEVVGVISPAASQPRASAAAI